MTFAAEIAAKQSQAWTAWVEIDGIGDVNGLYKFSTGILDTPGSATWYDYMSEFPDLLAERADVIGGTSDYGGLTFSLADVNDDLSTIFAINGQTAYRLDAALTTAGTSVTMTAGGYTAAAVNDILYIGAEAMLVTAKPGTPTLTVTRAALGTTAMTHAAGDECYFNSPPFLHGRRAHLYLAPTSGSVADQFEAGAYSIRDLSFSEDLNVWTFTAVSQLAQTKRVVPRRDATATLLSVQGVHHMHQGTATPHWSTGTPADPNNQQAYFKTSSGEIITGRFDGGFHRMVIRRGVLDTPQSDESVGSLTGSQLTQIMVAEDVTPGSFRWSSTGSTDLTDSSWAISNHFVDIILNILTSPSTIGGDASNKDATYGNWASLPGPFGANVPTDKIDIAGMMAIKQRTASYKFPRFWYGDETVEVGELINKTFLQPIGAYLSYNNGVIGIVLPKYPSTSDSIYSLGTDEILVNGRTPRARIKQTVFQAASGIIYELPNDRKLPVTSDTYSGGFGADDQYAAELSPVMVDAKAVDPDRSNFLIQAGASKLFRYHKPVFDINLDASIESYSLNPGDVVQVTLPDAPLLNGTRGWSGLLCQVQEKEIHVDDRDGAWVALRLIGYASNIKVGKVGPSAKVVSISGSGPYVVTIDQNFYTRADALNGLPVTDGSAFTVGYECLLTDINGAGYPTTATLTAKTDTTLTFDGNFGGSVVAGLRIQYADATFQSDIDTYVFFADETTLTVAGVDEAFRFGEA